MSRAFPPENGKAHRIVGITYSAPARMPVGQREVMFFRRV
jgi:hypothetical protein